MNALKTILLLTLAHAATLPAHAALVSTLNPLGRTLGGTPTGGNFISAADFQTLITTAGNTAIAGVFDNEITGASGALNMVETSYSAAGITLTGATRYARIDSPAAGVTSGARGGFISGSETWTLASKSADSVISEFGVIVFNQSNTSHLITATATLTDNSTIVYTSPTTDAAPGAGTFEFVGFRAPAGLGIKSVAISEPAGGAFLALDDIAYKLSPVPEPSIAILGMFGLGAGLGRRRRRHTV